MQQRAAQMNKYQLLRGTDVSLSMLNFEFNIYALRVAKNRLLRGINVSRPILEYNLVPTGMRRVLRKTITERYKRVAVHAKILPPQVEASIITTMPRS